MGKMLDVLNVSTGRNTATSDKFPNRILTGIFDAGFSTQLMTKDVRLYAQSVQASGAHGPIGAAVHGLLEELVAALPDSDFTRIYPYVEKVRKSD
jgi:3-hydroxyisobutyrate dehydrogenase